MQVRAQPGGVELRAAWWRAVFPLLAGAAMIAAGAALLWVAGTGDVIDAGWFGNLLTRVLAGLFGLLFLLGGIAVAAGATAIRRHARVVVGPHGVALVAPTVPDRSVCIPWAAIETIGVLGGPRDGRASLLPDGSELVITLRRRPAGDAVLELLESEPGRIGYRLAGFDAPAVRRAVNHFTLRFHAPAPGPAGPRRG